MDPLDFIIKNNAECVRAYNLLISNIGDTDTCVLNDGIIVYSDNSNQIAICSNGLCLLKNGTKIKTTIEKLFTLKDKDGNFIGETVTAKIASIYNLIKNTVRISVEIDNYSDLFDAVSDKIYEKNNDIIVFKKPDEMTTSIGVTVDIKKDGEEFGLGKYSTVGFSFLMNMQVGVNSIKDFTSFAYNIGSKTVNDLFENYKQDRIKKGEKC